MVRVLRKAGYRPVVFDNLSTGRKDAVPEGVPLVVGDLQNPAQVKGVFKKFGFSAVLHFAASSIVPESVSNPLKYYRNNVAAFLVLLGQMEAAGVKRLIFSSTAAVYGQPAQSPIREDFPLQPLNPYGRSKAMMEQITGDYSRSHEFSYAVFRYFNAAGADASGETGEAHEPETHLIPNLLAAAEGDTKEFTLFGSDYPTPDGTCVRDYVHVEDLCRAHLLGLRYLENGGANEIFNLGSQCGYSVAEVLRAAERITGKGVPVKWADRRPGDPPQLIADSQKAGRVLGWKAEQDLETILRSAHQWYLNKKNRLVTAGRG